MVKAGTEVVETVVVDRPKLRRFEVSEGRPCPLGASLRDGGVNFAVFAGNAVSAALCLITPDDLEGVSDSDLVNLAFNFSFSL